MTLENYVIKLRPHHAERVFWDWNVYSQERLYSSLSVAGYSMETMFNAFRIKNRIMRENNPLIIVPALDDICEKCNKHRQKCDKIDSQKHFGQLQRLGLKHGEVYYPADIMDSMIKILESGYIENVSWENERQKEKVLMERQVVLEIYKRISGRIRERRW